MMKINLTFPHLTNFMLITISALFYCVSACLLFLYLFFTSYVALTIKVKQTQLLTTHINVSLFLIYKIKSFVNSFTLENDFCRRQYVNIFQHWHWLQKITRKLTDYSDSWRTDCQSTSKYISVICYFLWASKRKKSGV